MARSIHSAKQAALHNELSEHQQARQAVLLALAGSPDDRHLRVFEQLHASEWRRLLRWLDVSGVALLFYDRLAKLNRHDLLPRFVQERLQQNLCDNTARMRSMVAESLAIHANFERAGLNYAILKGISLWPESVPKLELRSQLDIDFLVAVADLPAARIVLEKRGYTLHAISGRSWEFKTRYIPTASLKSLYKDSPFRAVELHGESPTEGLPSLLNSACLSSFHGTSVPVLSAEDLFLGQAIHLYKHVCSAFFRVAHLVEFRRHVTMRFADTAFWARLCARHSANTQVSFALGVVVHLATRLMGDFAPDALAIWTVDRLPAFAKLWVDRYACRTALGEASGNKLYLLLERELRAQGVVPRRPARRVLLPLRLPPMVIRGYAGEGLSSRMRRYRLQLRFLLMRARFHAVEGLRYAWELPRWRHLMDLLGAARSLPSCPAGNNKEMTISQLPHDTSRAELL